MPKGPNLLLAGSPSLGIITSGVAFQYAREAAPQAGILKIGMTYPLPIERMRRFAGSVESCVVIEEGDPYLVEAARTAGIAVKGKPEMYRFGELNTDRVRRILAEDTTPEQKRAPGKPPALCPGLPASQRLYDSERAGLHRCGRYWLLFAGSSAAL